MTEKTNNPFVPWTKPKTVPEALERSLEQAEDEKRWMSGAWWADTSINAIVATIRERVRKARDLPEGVYHHLDLEAIEEQELAPFCRSVRACSAGILLLVCGDGKLLKKRLIEGEDMEPTGELRGDQVAREAAVVLAMAFTAYDNSFHYSSPSPSGSRYSAERAFTDFDFDALEGHIARSVEVDSFNAVVSTITSVNDSSESSEHHEKIVAMFGLAVRIAQEAQARGGIFMQKNREFSA